MKNLKSPKSSKSKRRNIHEKREKLFKAEGTINKEGIRESLD
jgi:hypothetical protein